MRILGQIGAFNEPVARGIAALQAQTRPLDEILVVDNSDSPARLGPVPVSVTLLEREHNWGSSGCVEAAFQYGIEHGFDWVWIFDGDSAPRPNVLEELLALYARLGPEVAASVGVLAPSHVLGAAGERVVGRRYTPGGPRNPRIDPSRDHYECDAMIWSGSLFRADAVAKAGMPRHGPSGPWDDLAMDYGDLEYAARIRAAGYRVVVHRNSFVDHQLGHTKNLSVLGVRGISTNHSPSRRYLYHRNLVFFWVHLYRRRSLVRLAPWLVARVGLTMAKIAAVEDDRIAKLRAILKGIWDGARKQVSRPYA